MTAGACFRRSGVTKIPLITASHLFALSAGISPGNGVFTGFELAPHVFASAVATSTSNPLIVPLEEASSIGGNVGSVQNLKVLAPVLAPAGAAATASAASADTRIVLRIPPPLAREVDPTSSGRPARRRRARAGRARRSPPQAPSAGRGRRTAARPRRRHSRRAGFPGAPAGGPPPRRSRSRRSRAFRS